MSKGRCRERLRPFTFLVRPRYENREIYFKVCEETWSCLRRVLLVMFRVVINFVIARGDLGRLGGCLPQVAAGGEEKLQRAAHQEGCGDPEGRSWPRGRREKNST